MLQASRSRTDRTCLRLLALAVAALASCGPPPVRRPPSVALFVVDTLRVDAVSAYGYLDGTTPTLDTLAKEGLRYTRAYAQAPWTLPSHATIFTGLLPSQHRMGWRQMRAPDEWRTLAEMLQQAGYETVGVSENGMLCDTFNMTQGFEQFTNVRDNGLDAPTVVAEWLRRRDADRPFFLFVNLFDAHGPFEVRQQNPFLPPRVDPETARTVSQLPERHFCMTSQHDETMSILWGLYLGDVRAADAKLGMILEILRQGQLEPPLVTIVTSDHGEHFGEHRLFQHQFSVREPLLHVPLVVQGRADAVPAVIDAPVQLADLMPTILEWAGVAVPPGLAGQVLPTHGEAQALPRSLIAEHDDYLGELAPGGGGIPPLMKKQGDITRGACGPNDRVFGGMRTIIRHPSKLIWYEGYSPQLYDLLADPEEDQNLAAAHPETVAALTAELHRQTGVPPDSTAAIGGGRLERDQIERLRALGYITVDEPKAGGS
jgi:arylsulfatase A-like enzyme